MYVLKITEPFRFKLKITNMLELLCSIFSIFAEFEFGVDDAAIVVMAALFTVAKLPEAPAQLHLVDFPICERDCDLVLICKSCWISILNDIQEINSLACQVKYC